MLLLILRTLRWNLQRKLVFWTLLLGDITNFLKAPLPVVLPFGQRNAVCFNLGLKQHSVLTISSGQEWVQRCGNRD